LHLTDALCYPFLADGKAAERIRAIDWSRTAIGPVSGWSESFKGLLGTMSHSRQPMVLLVGADLVQIYNDAYIDKGLSRHPDQMGALLRSTWPELVEALDDEFADVLNRGISTLHEDSLIRLVRDGRLVDTYWCYGCTPFVDGRGAIGGVLVMPAETTQRVLAEQRQRTLQAFSEALFQVTAIADLAGVAMRAMATATQGSTALWFYRTPKAAFSPTLQTDPDPHAGAGPGDAPRLSAARAMIQWFHDDPASWRRLQAGEEVRNDRHLFVPLPIKQAAEVIRFIDYEVDPRLPFDDAYRQFLRQLTERLSQASDRLEAAASRASIASERHELLMQAPVATAMLTGPDLVFTLANAQYRELSGHRELVGKTYEQAFPELVGTALPALMHGIFASGEPYASRKVWCRWFAASARPRSATSASPSSH
jgi:PAS domain-containing protein